MLRELVPDYHRLPSHVMNQTAGLCLKKIQSFVRIACDALLVRMLDIYYLCIKVSWTYQWLPPFAV